MPVPGTGQTSNALQEYTSKIWVLRKIDSQKTRYLLKHVTLAYTLDYLGVLGISYSFSVNSLCYFKNFCLFWRKIWPPALLFGEWTKLQPSSLCKVREIQLWLIKITCFTSFLLLIKLVIKKKKTLNLTNLQKRLLICW